MTVPSSSRKSHLYHVVDYCLEGINRRIAKKKKKITAGGNIWRLHNGAGHYLTLSSTSIIEDARLTYGGPPGAIGVVTWPV
jgi:hypothetical protein